MNKKGTDTFKIRRIQCQAQYKSTRTFATTTALQSRAPAVTYHRSTTVRVHSCLPLSLPPLGCIFGIRVFHPNSPSYLKTQPASLFRRHELEKKREYGDRVRSVVCGSFTPLVFSKFGGLGREATIFYTRLTDLLSKKHRTPRPIPRHSLMSGADPDL